MDDDMILPFTTPDPADLRAVLAAWNGATVRLEQTHAALRDEVRRLNQELETKNRELARKNRLADLGQMASHVAHEVRNNLVPVSLYLSLLRRRLGPEHSAVEVVDKIGAGLTALDATVNDLLHFASDREPQLSTTRVADVIDELQTTLSPQLVAQHVSLDLHTPRDLVIQVDRDMLRRALLNLLLNAIDALPRGGEITVTVVAGPQFVEIEVADNGAGLSAEQQRRAFEPFFTTKSTGTGLGLSIVYRVAESHGGDVVAMNCPEGGAAFTIRLPLRKLESRAA